MPTMKPFMNADWILFAPIAYFFLPMMSTIAYYICWLDYLCTMFSWMSSNRGIRPCPMQLLARNGDLMAGLDVSHGSMAFMTLFYVPYAANAMMTWKGNYIWGKTVIWGAFGCYGLMSGGFASFILWTWPIFSCLWWNICQLAIFDDLQLVRYWT
jgi:hypothetical protein